MSTGPDKCNEVLISIRRIIRAIDIHSKQLITAAGVTGPQLVILNEIKRNTKITTTELSNIVSLSQPTVTNILSRLERRQFIVKTHDVIDKRKRILTLTVQGARIVGNTPSLMQANFMRQYCLLPEWQQNQILSSLQRVADMMYDIQE